MKQHMNAAAKLQNKRLVANQSEGNEMVRRGGGSEMGARLQRLKQNFNQVRVGPSSEMRARQNSSEVGYQNHNALKQFAIDQLCKL